MHSACIKVRANTIVTEKKKTSQFSNILYTFDIKDISNESLII